jgi:hypothetical protein
LYCCSYKLRLSYIGETISVKTETLYEVTKIVNGLVA